MRNGKTSDELLAGAIEVIERDGWHQHDLYQPPPYEWTAEDARTLVRAREEAAKTAPVCAMGALHRASSGSARCENPEDEEGYLEAIRRLSQVVDCSAIPDWNDARETTKEDVILGFKRALHGR